ncbi:MAG: hypothetical protein AAF974_10445 [Cyanobacteria bacterium P01_E01_bin.34]
MSVSACVLVGDRNATSCSGGEHGSERSVSQVGRDVGAVSWIGICPHPDRAIACQGGLRGIFRAFSLDL